MAGSRIHIKKKYYPTEYKYVHAAYMGAQLWYFAHLGSWKFASKNIRECAIAVDKKLIEKGKRPVNILKYRGSRPA